VSIGITGRVLQALVPPTLLSFLCSSADDALWQFKF